MEKCKVCGKKFKAVTQSHLKTHGLTLEEYQEKYSVSDFDETDEPEIKEPKEEKPKNKVFDLKQKEYADLPLQEFLNDYEINEKELRAVVRKYKSGDPIPTSQEMKNKNDAAVTEAKKLKDLSEAKTHNLYVAEMLEKQFGFKTVSVKGNPKTWTLVK